MQPHTLAKTSGHNRLNLGKIEVKFGQNPKLASPKTFDFLRLSNHPTNELTDGWCNSGHGLMPARVLYCLMFNNCSLNYGCNL